MSTTSPLIKMAAGVVESIRQRAAPLDDAAAEPRARGGHVFKLKDGRHLEYRVFGRAHPDDPVVVCLPGLWPYISGFEFGWINKVWGLEPGLLRQNCLLLLTRIHADFKAGRAEVDAMPFTFACLSRPGYGASTLPGRPWDYTYDDLVPDVAALADRLGAATFSVFGWSSGGPCALAVAHGLPDRVAAALALCSDASYYAGHPRAPVFVEGAAAAAAPATGYHSDGFGPWRWLGTFFYKVLPPGCVVDFWNEWRRSAWFENLESIACPVLLYHTCVDALVDPNTSRYMATRLPNCRLTLVPGATGADHTRLPADVWDAMVRALGDAARTRALPPE